MREYVTSYEECETTDHIKYTLPIEKGEEIVRCRDCKYYEDYTGCCTRRDCVAPMAVTAGGFCAWAERRGDE